MDPAKVITGIVTLVNANIWEPISIKGNPPIYTATIIIPKGETKTLDGIRTAIKNANIEGSIKFKGMYFGTKAKKMPLLDGDQNPLATAFADCFVLNASSLVAPQIVDYRVCPISDRALVGSGCKVRVSLTFYPYMNGGEKGIGCMLGNIQKALVAEQYDPIPQLHFDTFLSEFLHILLKN